jgi:RimJ/RimL family protein N-acetyltransferase
MTRGPEPNPAHGLMELDGDSLRMLTVDDLPALARLREAAPHELFELPSSPEEIGGFVQGLATRPWSLPMLCCHDDEPVGLCLMSVAQLKNLNAYLVAVFEQPASAAGALALYVRHAFWSYPLHRLYTQLPSNQAVRAHAELYSRVGFSPEGVLVKHIATDFGPADAMVLGILRDEFDAWCAANQPELCLA